MVKVPGSAVQGLLAGSLWVPVEVVVKVSACAKADEGVHFERAWLDPESGKVFCLSTGPSKESVLRVHERAGHPTAEIYELPVDIS